MTSFLICTLGVFATATVVMHVAFDAVTWWTVFWGVTAVVAFLVRAAEMIEQRDGGAVWDNEVNAALAAARDRGWGQHQTGSLDQDRDRQIAEWRRLQRRSVDARDAVGRAEGALEDFVEDHCRRYPLTTAQRAALRTVLRTGRQLCCGAGVETLAEIVDPIWAEVINGWAYEALSCSKAPAPRRREEQLQKLEAKLKEWS